MQQELILPKLTPNIVVNKGSQPRPPPAPAPQPRPKPSSATEEAFFSLPIWLQWLIKLAVFVFAFGAMLCGVFTCKARNIYRLNSMIAGIILM